MNYNGFDLNKSKSKKLEREKETLRPGNLSVKMILLEDKTKGGICLVLKV